jgi:hypothetical protein
LSRTKFFGKEVPLFEISLDYYGERRKTAVEKSAAKEVKTMAVSVNVTKRSMSILVDEGVDANGKAVTKAYAFNNVKPDADPAKIAAAGQALGGLFAKDMTGIILSEKAELIAE